MGNGTFRGNVSCKFDIDVPIIIFGDFLINVTNKYVEIKPQNKILLYEGLILGLGYVNAYIDLPPPVDIFEEFEGFLFLFFLFLKFKFFK